MLVVRFTFLPDVAQDFIDTLDEERRVAEVQYEDTEDALYFIKELKDFLEEVVVMINGKVVALDCITGEVGDFG